MVTGSASSLVLVVDSGSPWTSGDVGSDDGRDVAWAQALKNIASGACGSGRGGYQWRGLRQDLWRFSSSRFVVAAVRRWVSRRGSGRVGDSRSRGGSAAMLVVVIVAGGPCTAPRGFGSSVCAGDPADAVAWAQRLRSLNCGVGSSVCALVAGFEIAEWQVQREADATWRGSSSGVMWRFSTYVTRVASAQQQQRRCRLRWRVQHSWRSGSGSVYEESWQVQPLHSLGGVGPASRFHFPQKA